MYPKLPTWFPLISPVLGPGSAGKAPTVSFPDTSACALPRLPGGCGIEGFVGFNRGLGLIGFKV